MALKTLDEEDLYSYKEKKMNIGAENIKVNKNNEKGGISMKKILFFVGVAILGIAITSVVSNAGNEGYVEGYIVGGSTGEEISLCLDLKRINTCQLSDFIDHWVGISEIGLDF
ncbi:unnamed protein product [marine sediment metagenome]|uniref:Uncharacterized protein n=1 Tax=marine sediment metagenome TaxID=412755 RepID=X1UIV5_9ZZZZ